MQLPFLPHSRNDIPELLNAMGLKGLAAEIGTQRGHYAEHFLRHWKGERLTCVDPYTPYEGMPMDAGEHEACFREAHARLSSAAPGRFTIVRETSLFAASYTALDSLDFVYIDGDHDYRGVLGDISLWWPRVKSGGVLAGHDYVLDGWHVHGEAFASYATKEEAPSDKPVSPFYVRRAVRKYFLGSEIYLTSPEADGGWQSWLVVKP